jgi:hypothetical protein
MSEVKARDPIPEFNTLNDIAEFWDKHSTAEYQDVGEEVQFEVKVHKRPRRITLMPELREQIEVHARARGVSAETLVNLWLAEHLQQAA